MALYAHFAAEKEIADKKTIAIINAKTVGVSSLLEQVQSLSDLTFL